MFQSAEEKLKRANHHIADFDRRCIAFSDSNPYRTSIKPDADGNGIRSITFEQRGTIDPGISTVFGDAVHNLACVLDHITWEIVGLDTGDKQVRDLHFPRSSGTRADFEATVGCMNGQVRPRPDTEKFFKSLEVYKGGKGKALFEVIDLDIRDKHLRLTPMYGIAHAFGFIMRGAGEMLEVIDSPFGKIEGIGSLAGTITITMATGSSLPFNEQPKIAPFIGFEDVEPFPNQPILPRLTHMSREVRGVLIAAREFMRKRLA